MSAESDARLVWSAIAEPGDEGAHWLVDTLGACDALDWVDGVAKDPVTATTSLLALASRHDTDAAVTASERWARRREGVDAATLRARARACGARTVVPGDSEWPESMDDLGGRAPFALWVRGEADVDQLFARSVAIVGCRASTSYGTHVAADLGAAVARTGRTVISGGAYGIDAAAHRGALVAGGLTLAVMAGGVDRLYPAGNADLLESIMKNGAVISDVPPGWAPHRSRFLSRNRLIACAGATVVVEAALRSGARSTALHAQTLLRPVGVVPGPVTSAASAGCHDLIRHGEAVLVTSAEDVLELAGPLEVRTSQPQDPASDGDRSSAPEFACAEDRRAFDALGTRSRQPAEVATIAGLTLAEVRASMGRLELSGLVTRDGPGWRRQRASGRTTGRGNLATPRGSHQA